MTTRVEIASEPTGPTAPEATPAADPNRPAWLDPQFKDGEALAQSYKALQAELTRVKQGKGLDSGDPNKGVPDPAKPTDPAKPAEGLDIKDPAQQQQADAAKKVVEKTGFDVSSYSQEFDTTGDVSAEGREAITKGLEAVLGPDARTIVDQYIDARKGQVVSNTQMIKDTAGGADAYSTMVNWAATTLKPDEIAAFNAQVNSGNIHTATFAVEALKARFQQANGKEPARFKGTFTPTAGLQGYKSTAEMQADMRDPRYKTDPAFREQVRAKLAMSG